MGWQQPPDEPAPPGFVHGLRLKDDFQAPTSTEPWELMSIEALANLDESEVVILLKRDTCAVIVPKAFILTQHHEINARRLNSLLNFLTMLTNGQWFLVNKMIDETFKSDITASYNAMLMACHASRQDKQQQQKLGEALDQLEEGLSSMQESAGSIAVAASAACQSSITELLRDLNQVLTGPDSDIKPAAAALAQVVEGFRQHLSPMFEGVDNLLCKQSAGAAMDTMLVGLEVSGLPSARAAEEALHSLILMNDDCTLGDLFSPAQPIWELAEQLAAVQAAGPVWNGKLNHLLSTKVLSNNVSIKEPAGRRPPELIHAFGCATKAVSALAEILLIAKRTKTALGCREDLLPMASLNAFQTICRTVLTKLSYDDAFLHFSGVAAAAAAGSIDLAVSINCSAVR